jgi:hypothetical protein
VNGIEKHGVDFVAGGVGVVDGIFRVLKNKESPMFISVIDELLFSAPLEPMVTTLAKGVAI